MNPLEIKTDEDMNFTIHGFKKICSYCDVKPVAEPFSQSCMDCTYICEGCKQLTPYESGGSDDMPNHCDECWMEAHA